MIYRLKTVSANTTGHSAAVLMITPHSATSAFRWGSRSARPDQGPKPAHGGDLRARSATKGVRTRGQWRPCDCLWFRQSSKLALDPRTCRECCRRDCHCGPAFGRRPSGLQCWGTETPHHGRAATLPTERGDTRIRRRLITRNPLFTTSAASVLKLALQSLLMT